MSRWVDEWMGEWVDEGIGNREKGVGSWKKSWKF